jgi:hypothetical protein
MGAKLDIELAGPNPILNCGALAGDGIGHCSHDVTTMEGEGTA